MKVNDIISVLEESAPPALQESYDNSGLLIGDRNADAKSALLCIDVTEEVLQEAIDLGTNLIIAHHPLIFGGVKRITGGSYVERCISRAIKNDIAVYAIHTNLDNTFEGVNKKIAGKLGLQNCEILAPLKNRLCKLVAFVPEDHADNVRRAIFEAGAGHIGDYDCCSYNLSGKGTFRGGEGTNPFVGQKGEIHFENETRIETIFPDYLERRIISAMIEAHPYEEAAYDVYPLRNTFNRAGAGMIGELSEPADPMIFLAHIKNTFAAEGIRFTKPVSNTIKKVALCGGSGSGFLNAAIRAKADIFISGDFKYHQFFDADNRIMIADIGHYESEQFTTEVIYDLISKKLPTFAIHFSEINTNPIKYF